MGSRLGEWSMYIFQGLLLSLHSAAPQLAGFSFSGLLYPEYQRSLQHQGNGKNIEYILKCVPQEFSHIPSEWSGLTQC